ncbi:hypothetical protein BU15DRAFT_75423 [Melanogaster broomeanus]|nr:hypothetical protein BU15DRAFT_75423 [Melanogaster broomeanus]
MAGFLRKKAKKNPPPLDTNQHPSLDSSPSKISTDVPPSLPPLFAQFAASTLVDPAPTSTLLSSYPISPPLSGLPTPPADPVIGDDDWNPWRGYADLSTTSPLAGQPRANVTGQISASIYTPPLGRALNGASLSQNSLPAGAAFPRSAKLSATNAASSDAAKTHYTAFSRPSPVSTDLSPRKATSRQVREEQNLPPVVPSKDAAPSSKPLTSQPKQVSPNVSHFSRPPAVVRGSSPPTSSFDFEELLSAANVTSVVNQFRSYPTQSTPHQVPSPPATQDPHKVIQSPQPSNGHTKVIDGRTDERRSSRHSTQGYNSNGFPLVDGRPRSSSINHSPTSTVPPSSSQPSFTNNPVTTRTLRAPPSAPPTSYADRNRAPLARQTSHSSQSSFDSSENHAQPPMPFDALRIRSVEQSGAVRKGPLIFGAMAAGTQPNGNVNGHYAYPSPPAEYASLEPSGGPTQRSASISSVFQNASQSHVYSQNAPPRSSSGLPFEPQHSPRKRSKSGSVSSQTGGAAPEASKHRMLTKARRTPPSTPTSPPHKLLLRQTDSPLLDYDPFANMEGVQVVRSKSRASSREETHQSAHLHESKEQDGVRGNESAAPETPSLTNLPPTPVTPDDYKSARQQRRGQWLEKGPPPLVAEVISTMRAEGDQEEQEPPREPTPPPAYFPIVAFMSDADLLPLLLAYLSYSEWLALYSANKSIREVFQSRILREFVLERYLSTVGYSKWEFEWAEPLALSLKDLHDYMRGVSMPTHQYARLATAYLHPNGGEREDQSISASPDILSLAFTTRAYTRVVLRLRAQAESEARHVARLQAAERNQTTTPSRPTTRNGHRQPSASSRAPSPSSSGERETPESFEASSSEVQISSLPTRTCPLLRVFVPSPDGDWLSDASVLECEAELRRSGAIKLLRAGDVVWDVAVGDEGNLGRLVWDGSYLVDLDYKYSRMGELSPYFHSLAFSPSYFHRVIRIGSSATHNPHCNPLVYVDASPWGKELATNLQLLQDRTRTETPSGALHDVVRWVHRSSFTIRPPVPLHHAQAHLRPHAVRVPIPNVEGCFIDPGWYGTVVVEAEGTNEGLADLQERCGPGAFPPRAENVVSKIRNAKEKESRRTWRILREKSRPGELWLRAVREKERVM